MEALQMAVLGAVQGATEFLPVSSSGHLAAGKLILKMESLGNNPLLLEISLHIATLLAVVIVYRADVLKLLLGAGAVAKGAFKEGLLTSLLEDRDGRLLGQILVATLPTGIIGVAMEKTGVAGSVASTPVYLGISFIGCAGILALSRFEREKTALSYKMALIIGVAQGLAVMPGISRSGATIACAMLLGVEREEAAKFSFLLSIPAILGAAILEIDPAELANSPALPPLMLGALAAFLVGLAALMVLIKIVKAGRLWLFAPYVFCVGCCTILFF